MLSKNLLYYSKFEFFYKCMCLLQFLITRKDDYIILLAIPRIICPMKANTTHIFWALLKICIFQQRFVPSEGHFSILYNFTLKLHWAYF